MRTLLLITLCFCSLNLKASETRIVSLTPALTETLFDLGLGDKIVGTVAHADWPQQAKDIPRVGSYQRPSIEKIVALKPSIVLAQKEGIDRFSSQIKKLGIPIRAFESNSLDDLPKMLLTLGKLFAKEKKAQELVTQWETSLSNLPHPFRPIPLLILVEADSQIFVGKSGFLQELFARCGGENLIEEKGYPRVSSEILLTKKPEKIFSLDSDTASVRTLLKRFPNLSDKKLILLDPNKYSRLTFRLSSNAPELCRQVVEDGD